MPVYKHPRLKDFKPIYWKEFVSDILPKALDKHHKALLIFAYLTGARPQEIFLFVRQDAEITQSYIKLKIITLKRKDKQKRLILIPLANSETRFLANYIKEKKFPKEYIFTAIHRKRTSRGGIDVINPRDMFIRLNAVAGIGDYYEGNFYPHNFYIFRHNILTLLAEHGADWLDIAYYKGQSLKFIFKSMAVYLHFSMNRAKKLARILRKVMS